MESTEQVLGILLNNNAAGYQFTRAGYKFQKATNLSAQITCIYNIYYLLCKWNFDYYWLLNLPIHDFAPFIELNLLIL